MFLRMENFPHPIFRPVPTAARRVQTGRGSLGLGGMSTPSCGGCWCPRGPKLGSAVRCNGKTDAEEFRSEQKPCCSERRKASVCKSVEAALLLVLVEDLGFERSSV